MCRSLTSSRPSRCWPPAQDRAVLNFNSTAGLWKVAGNRIELATGSGVHPLAVPSAVMANVKLEPMFRDPAITDETPLLFLGALADGRGVWLHAVEDVDAGTLDARYLTAPPPYRLTRANSHFIFGGTPGIVGGGIHWGPRR